MKSSIPTLRDCFDLLDVTRTGKVAVNDIGQIMQLMRVVVKSDALNTIALKNTADGLFSFDAVERILKEALVCSSSFNAESLAESLYSITDNRNTLHVKDFEHLKRVLTGTQFDQEDLAYLFNSKAETSIHELVAKMISMKT